MSAKKQQRLVRKHVDLILKVRSGRMTASEAALEMGVSRKTYYKWEKRALEGMVSALETRPGGRPEKKLDPEKEELKEKLATLEKERSILEQRLNIHKAVKDLSHMLPMAKKK